MNSCLHILVEKNSISSIVVDSLKEEYTKLCSFPFLTNADNDYRRSETRLDHFWVQILRLAKDGFENFSKIMKVILIFSHVNADL